MAKQKSKSRARRSASVKRIVDQVKEPLSLLETLKEEGLARAMYLLGVASTASKSINKDKLREQLKDTVQNLGIVTRADFERLEARVEELESKLTVCDDDE
jgi:BMFP domain-containing protein YqiC